MPKINSRDLDNHITGHYGEDQFRRVQLIQSCNLERINEEDVDCLNIEEDIQGRDIVTFKCPNCNEEHKSVRLG